MARTTPETLLLSALVNLGDANAAKQFGVHPGSFQGYRSEYEWMQSYNERYGGCPSQSAFLAAFPQFPFAEDQTDVRYPADEVRRKFAARNITKAIMKATTALTAGNVEEAYEQFQGMRFETYAARPTSLLVDHTFMDHYTQVQDDRIPVPWETLQSCTNGIGKGELWYLAARPQNGKSSFMTDIAAEAALAGLRVNMYSLEMPKRTIQVRAHAILGHRLGHQVDAKAMLHRKFDPLKYKAILQDIEDRVPGVIDVHEASSGPVTPSVVASRAGEYDLTIIDYAGLMRTNSGSRAVEDWRHLAAISNELKEITLDKNVSVLAASQINREGDIAGPRPPKLKHLAQSDALGQDGDVVLTMKRYGLGAAMFSVEKNRSGESSHLFWCKFDANRGDFREITRDQADEIRDQEED